MKKFSQNQVFKFVCETIFLVLNVALLFAKEFDPSFSIWYNVVGLFGGYVTKFYAEKKGDEKWGVHIDSSGDKTITTKIKDLANSTVNIAQDQSQHITLNAPIPTQPSKEQIIQDSYERIVDFIVKIHNHQYDTYGQMLRNAVTHLQSKVVDHFEFESHFDPPPSHRCSIRIISNYHLNIMGTTSGSIFAFRNKNIQKNIFDARDLDDFFNDLEGYAMEKHSIVIRNYNIRKDIHIKKDEQDQLQECFDKFVKYVERRFDDTYDFAPDVGNSNLQDHQDSFKTIFQITPGSGGPTQININDIIYSFHHMNQMSKTRRAVILSVGGGTNYHQIETKEEKISFFKKILLNALKKDFFIELKEDLIR